MVTQATINERIDHSLSVISAEIEDLRAVEEEWPRMLDDHQAAFLLEWDELMARLESLDRSFHSSLMNSAQQARYHALICKFGESLRVIERLGLPRPRILKPLS